MKVDISRIVKHSGASVDVNLKEKADFEGLDADFIDLVSINGKITNMGEVFVFEGSVSSKIMAECDRCLSAFEYGFNIDINEKFVYGKTVEFDDVNVFNGSTIDLTDVIKNNIILNLPIQFVCKDDCKGLCSHCGCNRNINQCNCQEEAIDARLEKLKSLLNLK